MTEQTDTAAEPCHDIAHLAHVEMYTDRYEESLRFFTDVYGLTLSGEDERSAYLRAFDDYEFHSLKLTRHHTTGVGHVAYRAQSPAALARRVKAIEASGYKLHGWQQGDLGHGEAFRFDEGFRVPEAYESLPCRNPRSAAGLYGDLTILAWALLGLRAARQPVDDGAGRAFRPQAFSPRPGLAAICVLSASWAV